MKAALLSALGMLALSACAPHSGEAQAKTAEQLQRLETRVSELESEVAQLRAHSLTNRAPQITQAAAADACALEVARDLESYRAANDRYPAGGLSAVGGVCSDFRLKWLKLTPGSYSFEVLSQSGQVLSHRAAGE